jgi:NADPH:quinone reductase-like Zn-dependent oxidoreductase
MASKEPMLRRLGADDFIDYTQTPLSASGRRWDVIFDMVPDSDYSVCMRLLRPGGRYLAGNPRLAVMARSLITSWFSSKSATFAFARESRAELEELTKMTEAGEIVSIVDRVLPMNEVVEAHRLVETEQRLGAVVLSIA